MIKTPLSEEAGFIFICHYNQNVDFERRGLMKFVEYMERNVFFKIIRFFAFCICLLAFVVVVIGAISLITNFKNMVPSYDVKISIDDVQAVATEKENQKKQEQYSEFAKQELQNAWRAAQTYFHSVPSGTLTMESLLANGFIPTKGIKLDITNATQQDLMIQCKHELGLATYSINLFGRISEVASGAPTAKSMKTTVLSVSEQKIEPFINEVINLMPPAEFDQSKTRDITKRIALSLKDEYRIPFLQGLIDVLKQAPTDKKGEFAIQYVELYKERVSNKENENNEKEMKSWVNIATYSGAIGGGIIIIALFGLILVLLAIEKNTRISTTSETTS
jgi:hypothetical protein